jgi:hypothetical protein
MSGKRGRQDGGGGKPNKKRYVNKAVSASKEWCRSARQLKVLTACLQAVVSSKGAIPPNSQGILISCTNSKEQQAGREAIALFTEVTGWRHSPVAPFGFAAPLQSCDARSRTSCPAEL